MICFSRILKNGSVVLRNATNVGEGPDADGKFNDLSNASPGSTRRRSIFVRLKSFAMGSSAISHSIEESEGTFVIVKNHDIPLWYWIAVVYGIKHGGIT